MQTKFSTSTNILRDVDRDISYIPTPNSIKVVNQISDDFKKGIRSFNIIGSYGTGKSSLFWAFGKSLRGQKKFFDVNILSSPNVGILNFVGEYRSIVESFSDKLNVDKSIDVILSEIAKVYFDLGKKNPLLVIFIDEFGKFLEHASNNSPESELYFVQQLAEFVNDPDHNIVMITALHQNFDAYAYNLGVSQRQEWAKVKGRFREITFNEPVEQLLFLASEHLQSRSVQGRTSANIRNSSEIGLSTKSLNLSNHDPLIIADKIYPLDLISASVLTKTLQKYGQNERSLFSFLESTDETGLEKFDSDSNPFYNVACVYDYLIYNFYSFITSRFNPDFAAWSAIRNVIDTAERVFNADLVSYSKILKTVGLVNMNTVSGSQLGKDFLENYSETCLGIKSAGPLIDSLESKKLILYRNYSKRYVISEGTDLDFTTALADAGNKISEVKDIASFLDRFYQLPPQIAKAHAFTTGTTRLFEFKISDIPLTGSPKGDIDGFINLIFNNELDAETIMKHSSKVSEAIVYGLYTNTQEIKSHLFEIEKIRKVIEENQDDNFAVKELENRLQHEQHSLSKYILHNLYSDNQGVTWIYNGEIRIFRSKKEFNKFLSDVCSQVYSSAPIFKNELVNKHKLSGSIHAAKRNFLKALVNNWNKPELGFETSKFPPEKTIYEALLKQNGLDLYSDDPNRIIEVPLSNSFRPLWEASLAFLANSKSGKRPLNELIEILQARPFKMKQGLIDFWIATFLFIKRNDFALFSEIGYVPVLTDEIFELLIKNPKKFFVKAFDIEGVKLDIFNSYRVFLNQQEMHTVDNASFIETIKPFLTFYRELPEYSKRTKRLRKETLAIREAISNSRDPEKTFFEDFPHALGYTIKQIQSSQEEFNGYVKLLHDSIRELRNCYGELIDRFKAFILSDLIGEDIDFENYKMRLQSRFNKLKIHLCLPHQKIFVQRLNSELQVENDWLSSIAQAIVGKPLEAIRDEDEIILHDNLKSVILELDGLTNISIDDFDESKESIIGLQLSSFDKGTKSRSVRFPKSKESEVKKLEESIIKVLGKDKVLNMAALANAIDKLMNK